MNSMSYLEEYKRYLVLGYENQLANNFRRNDSLDFIAAHLVDLWDFLTTAEQQEVSHYSDSLYSDYKRTYKKVLTH